MTEKETYRELEDALRRAVEAEHRAERDARSAVCCNACAPLDTSLREALQRTERAEAECARLRAILANATYLEDDHVGVAIFRTRESATWSAAAGRRHVKGMFATWYEAWRAAEAEARKGGEGKP